MTVDKIKPLAETKFLNLYEADYTLEDGTTLPYVVASRHKLETVADIDKKTNSCSAYFCCEFWWRQDVGHK